MLKLKTEDRKIITSLWISYAVIYCPIMEQENYSIQKWIDSSKFLDKRYEPKARRKHNHRGCLLEFFFVQWHLWRMLALG